MIRPLARAPGAYACRDGGVYLMVNRPAHWQALAKWIHAETGNEEVLDPLFEGPSSRRIEYRELLDLFISELTARHTVAEIFHEWRDARYAKKNHVEPSITHRGLEFMLMRAVLNVYLADISFAAAIGQVLSGKPAIYITAAGYDDIAHHTGIQSPESLASLTRLDTHIHHLLRAVNDAPRSYHLIFLSDHGQRKKGSRRWAWS